MTVPDDLLLDFFRETTSRLLDLDPEKALLAPANTNEDDDEFLPDCRRRVLDVQLDVLKEVTERFEGEGGVTPARVQERLGRLQLEPDLSPELKAATAELNEAARIGVCKLFLYTEEVLASKRKTTRRNLQDEGRLDRTKLLEYLGLCRAAHKLPCVSEFLKTTGARSIFRRNDDDDDEPEEGSGGDAAVAAFPNVRLEHVQRLLAKGVGWDPEFVTAQCKRIFVEKPADVDYGYYDAAVVAQFRQLVQEMTIVLRVATLQIKSKQDGEMLSDLGKGGTTRVVSVQHSEFEVDQHGNKIESSANVNNAPERGRVDERRGLLTEDEKKRQLRMASEANVLQQNILGELFAMDEPERARVLDEAARASRKFTEEAMALPPGQDRIDFLRSVDPATSRKLLMHKIWSGMLQANGGKPPKMASAK